MSATVTIRRQANRIRVDEAGQLEVVDPGFEHIPLLQEVDPRFTVKTAALPSFSGSPRFRDAMKNRIEMTKAELSAASDHVLWKVHRTHNLFQVSTGTNASILDLKSELAKRLLKKCSLCALRCAVDRTSGERGRCGLGVGALVGEAFVHIAEEAPINPSLVLNLAGCGLRCRFCQQHVLLAPGRVRGATLDERLWEHLDFEGARSISFVGGNPSESLFACINFLAATPVELNVPVVWNTHGYDTPEVLALLDGMVDAYLPDLKYMKAECAERLSSAPGYVAAATSAIKAMVAQAVPTIVRLLVLPGHCDCCHIPALEFLADLGARNLLVSIRGQYRPDWKITAKDGDLAHRPTSSELRRLVGVARALGLTLV